jgi:YVTN family beta-propeller protein
MRLVQSQAAVALPRPGRSQKGCGIKKLAFALSLACLFAPASARAQNAYITNFGDNTVSVIDTATNTVVGSPIPVGRGPFGVAVTPDGSKVYVTNFSLNTVSVIAPGTDLPFALIPVGGFPIAVAVTPDGNKVYVANQGDGTVSVIATATNTVEVVVHVGYSTVPSGVAVTPDGSKVYVANTDTNNVAVIPTAHNTVTATIPVGFSPVAFGKFIQQLPSFAGTPGKSNCHGASVSALAQK